MEGAKFIKMKCKLNESFSGLSILTMIPPSCFLWTFVTSFNIPAIIRWLFLKQTQKFQSTASEADVTNTSTHSTKLMMSEKPMQYHTMIHTVDRDTNTKRDLTDVQPSCPYTW